MGSRLRHIVFLAALIMLVSPTLWASGLELRRISNFVLELRPSGNSNAWHIQYATGSRLSEAIVVPGPGQTAYFSHYNWLRSIDVEKGVVTGRWLFPGRAITGLFWKGDRLQVQVRMNSEFRIQTNEVRIFDFDPGKPRVPDDMGLRSGTSQTEGMRLQSRGQAIETAEVEKLLPELENTARRDSFSPWVRVELARAYWKLGKTDREKLVDEALKSESSHYSELLRISFYLSGWNQDEAAKTAFESGNAEFWKHGGDPRRLSGLPVWQSRFGLSPDISKAVQRDLMNRAYLANPWGMGAEEAWTLYGTLQSIDGNAQEAALWLARAEEARTHSLTLNRRDPFRYSELAMVIATSFVIAAILFVLVLFLRYRPQRQMRLAAEQAAGVRRPGFCNVEYWSRGERVAFLSIVIIAWVAQGYTATVESNWIGGISRTFQLDTDDLLDPVNASMIQSRLPQSPERDLLLAMTYQRNGEAEKAVQAYRALPEFAESWNNLGVILRETGRAEEARSAFQRALQVNPKLPEAVLNLNGQASDTWTEMHQRYVSGRPMVALPNAAIVTKAFGIDAFTWKDALRGPLSEGPDFRGFLRTQLPWRSGVLVLSACVGILALFFRPREVLKAPPKYSVIAELLLPGTGRPWAALGGVLLGACIFLSSPLWPVRNLADYSFYGYAYGIRAFPIVFDDRTLRIMANSSPMPSMAWLVGLLVINAGVILWWRRKGLGAGSPVS